jgi:hypothetical protein
VIKLLRVIQYHAVELENAVEVSETNPSHAMALLAMDLKKLRQDTKSE